MTVLAAPVRTRWPALAGLALAVPVAADLTAGVELAAVLALSATVYLGAAALGRGATWWVLLGTSVLLVTAGAADVEPTWPMLVAALALGGIGLARRAAALPAQAAALAGFGAVAVLALAAAPATGAWLVAAGLVGHAGWDLAHHRADRVVPRALAEACLVFDLLLAAAIAAVTIA